MIENLISTLIGREYLYTYGPDSLPAEVELSGLAVLDWEWIAAAIGALVIIYWSFKMLNKVLEVIFGG